MEQKNINCVCKDCAIHCTCELHKDYENIENGCNGGEYPITYCAEKDKMNY